MAAGSLEEIDRVLDGLDVYADRLCELSFETQSTVQLLHAQEALQRVVRKLRVPGHAMINQLAVQAAAQELGGTLGQAHLDYQQPRTSCMHHRRTTTQPRR
ncbi:hypothetical protein [Mycobacterium vicinigordonae]|uniref:DUF222 domain-containing protein n=1 Tax=Mycobacterium vicinigordonae TaxID=1719132 RepID=A0A7D6DZ38_9MYCO|nr:hypothetical protein [Mycobacterium vicinigordonae]QLL08224.1 hypothetical protein H0P51_04450 [Mycobacterium vicinigordonae]